MRSTEYTQLNWEEVGVPLDFERSESCALPGERSRTSGTGVMVDPTEILHRLLSDAYRCLASLVSRGSYRYELVRVLCTI